MPPATRHWHVRTWLIRKNMCELKRDDDKAAAMLTKSSKLEALSPHSQHY